MAKYRTRLPQLNGTRILTDGGLETVMIFHEGVELPYFASFDLLRSEEGRARLRAYFDPYIEIARRERVGLLLESTTWRASADWGAKLGLDDAGLAAINRQAIAFLEEVRAANETPEVPMVISACIGPRGDGYAPGALMSADEATEYHSVQARIFADTAADLISALTMNNIPEAIGVARAAQAAGMPIAVSFTVETDGRLPSGDTLQDAIETVDAATGAYPAYYMINCAHPTHFADALAGNSRIMGLRANASRCSHAELDEAETLDEGNPAELGRQFAQLLSENRQLSVLGGCCGTDHRHVSEIGAALRAAA